MLIFVSVSSINSANILPKILKISVLLNNNISYIHVKFQSSKRSFGKIIARGVTSFNMTTLNNVKKGDKNPLLFFLNKKKENTQQ